MTSSFRIFLRIAAAALLGVIAFHVATDEPKFSMDRSFALFSHRIDIAQISNEEKDFLHGHLRLLREHYEGENRCAREKQFVLGVVGALLSFVALVPLPAKKKNA